MPFLLVATLVLPLGARADEPASSKVADAVLIGAFGAASVAAYSLGAHFTGEKRSGFVLATIGGAGAGSMLGSWIGLGINASMKNSATTASRILFPMLLGLAGGVVGGLSAGSASYEPGTGRTVTHGVVIGLIVVDTIVAEIVSLSR